ncbi:MAG: ATPase F0F1 [Candidatus Kuenenia sp.]|nr:ATPase F0F1 [Candidatus Kuenenia hertensis]
MVDPARKKPDDVLKKFADEVGRKESRKIKGRREKKYKTVWFGMGMSGIIGWSITIPTLLGIAAGIWIDKKWPSPVSWTLTLLSVGIVVGCLNAWYWMKSAGKND